MANLFCFGLGYTARCYIARYGDRLDHVAGTVRDRDQTRDRIGATDVEVLAFNGTAPAPAVPALLSAADLLLVSVPPEEEGDPVLRFFAEAIARADRVATIVYLSTIGVYGDYGGAWIDETAQPLPLTARSRARLDAELAWRALAERCGKALAILRLAGIYGPGRNALRQVADSTARRVAKPGQVFNRIHVSDIAQAVAAAFDRRANGIFNVADDEPSPSGDPIIFAAGLLGRAPPPELPFEEAARTMSPLALSFYGETKRVRNDRLKRDLGVALHYPTYREGLRALAAAGEGAAP